jgi:outer membrane protein TolC
MAEANEQIGIAKAAFYPTVTLGAAAGFEGSSILNWLNWPSRLWAVGPTLTQTLFDAGGGAPLPTRQSRATMRW